MRRPYRGGVTFPPHTQVGELAKDIPKRTARTRTPELHLSSREQKLAVPAGGQRWPPAGTASFCSRELRCNSGVRVRAVRLGMSLANSPTWVCGGKVTPPR